MPLVHGFIRYGVTPSVTMPQCVTDHGLQVSLEGRIDNRKDLIGELSLPPLASDEAIIAAAYTRTGADPLFMRMLFGDFAVAIWDASRNRLLLGRDCFGVLPLYYHSTPGGLAWSSDLRALINATACSREPDPHFVAGFLSFASRGDVSPFKAIAIVPPASVVHRDCEGVRVQTYWRLDPERELRMKSDADYEAQFTSLFRDAVRDRLHSDGPVFCELSGGLDSSSIAGVADEICRRQFLADDAMQTISHIYEEVATFDDRPYIEIMENYLGRRWHHIEENSAPLLTSIADKYPFAEPSALWFGTKLVHAAKDRMASAKSNVLLSGIGGDHLCWSGVTTPPGVADDLSRLRVVRAFKKATQWAAATEKTRASIVIEAVRRLRGSTNMQPPPWVSRRFARSMGIDRGQLDDAGSRAFRLPSRRAQFIELRGLAAEISLQRSVIGEVDVRYPFLDRRLVEFAFTIPVDQHVRPNETRSLQRRAMSQFIPPEICGRRTKGGPAATIYRRFRQQWKTIKALFQDARVCEYGYVDREALNDSLQRAAHGQNLNAPGLLRLLAIESWLKGLEQSSLGTDSFERTEIANGRR